MKLFVAVFVLLGAACRPADGVQLANFSLSCHSASTATTRQVHCIRTDTRNGEVMRVDLSKLPISNGPTASAAGPAGRYQTSCTAASSDNQSDFYCVRLNSETGELLLLNLSKLSQTP